MSQEKDSIKLKTYDKKASELKKAKGDKDAKANTKKKDTGKKKKKLNLAQKFREMVAELKKVSWPSRKDLIRHSVVVIVFVVLVTIVIALYDAGLSTLIKLVI